MPPLKVAIDLASLRLPFKQALHMAARLGARGVEIDARGELRPQDLGATGLRQVRKMMEDLNLRVSAVTFRTRRGYNVQAGLEARVEATRQAMKFAYDMGASVVINAVGAVPAEPAGPDWELLVGILADLGTYGQHAGAMLAADTGSESGPDLARLLAALPAGSLFANFNPGNLMVNGFSPLEAVQALGTAILHVHATDAVRDLARGRGLETPLGRGGCDFPGLLGALEEHEYRGWFTISRSSSDDPVYEIGQAVQYLHNL